MCTGFSHLGALQGDGGRAGERNDESKTQQTEERAFHASVPDFPFSFGICFVWDMFHIGTEYSNLFCFYSCRIITFV